MKSPGLDLIATASALALIVLFPNESALGQGCSVPEFAAARTFDAGTNPVSVCSYAGIKLMGVRTGTALTLFWPLPFTNFVLESAPNFGSPNWQRVSETVRTNIGRCEVTMPLDQGQRYFRLRKI